MTEPRMLTRDPLHAQVRLFEPPEALTPDVLIHASFVNSYAVKTPEGLMLIDPGLTHNSRSVHEAVRAWSDAPLHTAVYTHGHADHAFGLRAFLEAGDTPEIVAQENVQARFDRYALTWGLNAHINQRQFSLPAPLFPKHFDPPTVTYRDELVRDYGGLEVRFHAARGETDDATWVWIPARKHLFVGDLIIWNAPNCGNPQKVQRYPVEWAEALETMAGLGAEWLFPGHGLAVAGEAAVRQVLTETARYLRVLIDQVLERINAGQTPEEIFHAVLPDPELATRPYLRPLYDHPKFIVRNLLRLWGGWWNGNAADLLPAPWSEQAAEIARLAGGVDAVVARGRALLEAGESVLAAHLAEWATRAAPEDREAQALKRDVYDRRLSEEPSLMGKGIYRAASNDARAVLGDEAIPAQTKLSLGGE
jgi:glyoxylase-like metal-dependent hydrolase (beta-lactamase superfamily II)